MNSYTHDAAAASPFLRKGVPHALRLTLSTLALLGAASGKAQGQDYWTFTASPDRISHPSGWVFNVSRTDLTSIEIVSCQASPSAPQVVPFLDPVKDYKIVSIYGAANFPDGGIFGSHQSKVNALTLPPTLTHVGQRGIQKCPDLVGTVIFPDSLNRLDNDAMRDNGFTQVSLPTAGVDFTANNVFRNSFNLTAFYWRGAYPPALDGNSQFFAANGAPGMSSKVTFYVEEAYLTSWNAKITNGPLSTDKPGGPTGNATWLGRPIRVGTWDVSAFLNPPPVIYTVDFEDGGGTDGAAAMDSLTCTNYVTYTLPANAFKMAGYTFAGWTNTVSGGGVYYPDQRQIVNLSPTGGVVTLTATWRENAKYQVAFLPGEGTVTGDMPNQPFIWGASDYLDANAFAREGYTFAGWVNLANNVTYADGELVSNLTGTEINGAVVNLTATWTANTFHVAFDPGDGDGTASSQTFTYDTAQELTTAAALGFEKTDYIFAGWTVNGMDVAFADGALVSNLTAVPNATVTLTALWVEDGGAEEWLYVRAINVAPNGNVTLEWDTALITNVKLKSGRPYLYEIHATDDLTAAVWDVYEEEAQDFTRDITDNPVHRTTLGAAALHLSPDKMFFKVKAIK